jgi:hypothetical protein
MKFKIVATLIALAVLLGVAYCTEHADNKPQATTPAAPSAEDNALKGLKID